ncbi:MAG: hypothetical protein ACJ77Z_05750 [Thermoleophilaceae bacterium]
MSRRADAYWLAALAVMVGAAAVIAATSPLGIDYGNLACHFTSDWCDEAGFPLHALIHGDFRGFFAQQPLMGPATLLVRAPFAALARFGGEDLLTVYRLGVFACLLVSGLVALKVARLMVRSGRPPLQCALIGGLIFINPAVFYAIDFGHPEEFVAAAACVASAVSVLERRWTVAAVALGLAVASKPWALLVAPAVLLAVAPRARRQVALVAALTTLLLYAPMIAGDPARFRAVLTGATELGSRPGTVTPANIWWFTWAREARFERVVAVRHGHLVTGSEVGYALPSRLTRTIHVLVTALALILAIAWYRSRASGAQPVTLLLLFAVIFLLRCLLDPGNHSYYHVPAIASLLAYEGLSRRGLPWASLVLIGALWATMTLDPHLTSDRTLALVYLGWTIPAVIAGLWLLFRRSRVAVS